jgi:CheY-like chemotaxis protein
MVLVIDDDGFYRSVIRRILEDDGYQVIEATNGAEGLEMFKMHRPTLVITDMRMPGMGGTEVIRVLRDMEPQVRVIAVSGVGAFYNVDLFQLAKDVGAEVILRKLDPTDRVLAEVRRSLDPQARGSNPSRPWSSHETANGTAQVHLYGARDLCGTVEWCESADKGQRERS